MRRERAAPCQCSRARGAKGHRGDQHGAHPGMVTPITRGQSKQPQGQLFCGTGPRSKSKNQMVVWICDTSVSCSITLLRERICHVLPAVSIGSEGWE